MLHSSLAWGHPTNFSILLGWRPQASSALYVYPQVNVGKHLETMFSGDSYLSHCTKEVIIHVPPQEL